MSSCCSRLPWQNIPGTYFGRVTDYSNSISAVFPRLQTAMHRQLICIATLSILTVAHAETPLRFDRDVLPILSDKCFFCHGPDAQNREADLRLDVEEHAKESAIVPGDVEASELIVRILSDDPDAIMPPPGAHKELKRQEIEILKKWVADGAEWTQHWAFSAPQKPAEPKVSKANWAHNDIDRFVMAMMESKGLHPRPQASKEKLIRRVTFDLTGLPPSLSEVKDFVADDSADAYERLVDRLLQSEHYGERMALMWLDAARYGDTSVFHADGPRDMWGWRDQVVKAYNQNMPFDQFSIMQLAGDLVADAPLDQKVLAGFNRNNGTTDEGGAIAEEYRIEYAIDRVKTTSTVWMGLTMECAQCHDHKYDPISQEDYYKFFAFFNVSSDGGMQTRKGNAAPMLEIPDQEKQRLLPGVQSELTDAKLQLETLREKSKDNFHAWLKDREPTETDQLVGGAILNVPLWEGKDGKVADLLKPKRVGKIKGDAKWVKSRSDWGLKFNGKNFVDLGNVGDFERTDSFSYGGWVKPEKKNTGALLARMDDAAAYRGYDVLVGDNRISVHIINTWPTNAIKINTKKQLKAGEWKHVMVTYDGSSKASGVNVYVDGEKWDWTIEHDSLTETIKTKKALLIGSRTPGSRLKGEVDEVVMFDRCLEADEVAQIAKTSAADALANLPEADRTDAMNLALHDYYLRNHHDEFQSLTKKIDQLSKREEELKKPLTTVMVMGDQAKPRDTFILARGAYDSPTETKVQPGTLSALPPMPEDAPRNRLGMAKWLFQDDHPLTARVAVNRYWQLFFGTGLVSTTEDFGVQGGFPSHPELLDHLAVDFRENGWNVKRMIKKIVMSSTYRQSSQSTFQNYRSDPNNQWLARGPRFRLQGEFVRDTALDLAGLLVKKIGGPSVKPYQPPGLWAEVGLGGNPKFKQDHGEKLYRRSIYTYWKRSAPPPAMMIFDAPTREKCTMKRPRTNTPLQALVTLNDIQFVEAARCFAERIIKEGGDDAKSRIAFALQLATARYPSEEEIETMQMVLDDATKIYRDDAESAKSLISTGEAKRDETLDQTEHAAWTIVASAILNLDETLVRE